MKMLKTIGIALIVMVIGMTLAGCPTDTPPDGNNPPTPQPPQKVTKSPGKFAATVLSGALDSGNAARGISLGTYTVANSRNVYFILRNVGDFPITGVTLTAGKLLADGGTFEPITDNGIAANPGAITVLETSGNTTVETIIEVAVNHGNISGLISQQYVQKADFAGTTIRITGKTADEEGNAVDVSLDVDIETLIKVAGFEVYYSVDDEATFTKAEYESGTGVGFVVPADAVVKLKNTGNVPLKYKVFENDVYNFEFWENYNEWVPLNADTFSEKLARRPFASWYGNAIVFIVDTQGVAFDNDGIDELVFRSNSSIVFSNYSTSNSAIFIGHNSW